MRVRPLMQGRRKTPKNGGFALPALPSVSLGAAGRCRCRHSKPGPRPVLGTLQRWHRVSAGTCPHGKALLDPH